MTLLPLRSSGELKPAALPTFLLIGATKCGTTALHNWLSRHPQVFIHPWKEMRFFLDCGEWARGPDWYKRQFIDRGMALSWGEASNGYTRGAEYSDAPRRIARLLPQARLVYMVRDPMARLTSHYRHRIATGREWRPPAKAVRADPTYVATGLYGAELARWHAMIAPEQILVVPFDQLVTDPEPWLNRIARHIGVDPAPDLPFLTHNAASERYGLPHSLRRFGAVPALRRPLRHFGHRFAARLPGAVRLSEITVDLPPELREEIAERFAADRAQLEALTGRDITKGWQ